MNRKLIKGTLAIVVVGVFLVFSYPRFLKSWLIKGRDLILWPIYNTDMGHTLVGNLKEWGIFDQYHHVKQLRGEYALELYQMMKDIHDVCEVTHVTYWADSGTILGALRHKGIIPWDDDLDITIPVKDREKFMKYSLPILEKLGYKFKEKALGFKLYSPQEKFKSLSNENSPSCDVFVAVEKNGRLATGWEHDIAVEDLLPLRLHDFGSMKIWINNNPMPYLVAMYGENCLRQAIRGYDHLSVKSRQSSAIPFDVSGERAKPAQPIEPLVDNKELVVSLAEKLGQTE